MSNLHYYNENQQPLFSAHRTMSLDVQTASGNVKVFCDFIDFHQKKHCDELSTCYHKNPHFSRLFFIRSKSMRCTMDGQTVTLNAGEIVLLPVFHDFRADYDKDFATTVFHIHCYDNLGFLIGKNLPTLQHYRMPELTDMLFKIVDTADQCVLDSIAMAALLPMLKPELELAAKRSNMPEFFRNLLQKIESIPPAQLRLENLAAEAGMSRSALGKSFQRTFGISFKEYQQNLLLSRARQLLQDQKLTISQIADMLGFENIFYFFGFFKRITGRTPKEFRQQYTFPQQ